MKLSTGVLAVSFVLGSAGCIASKESLGSDGALAADDEGTSASSASTDDGGHDGASGQNPPPTSEGSGESGGTRLDVGGLDATCAAIDHDTCYPAVVEACIGDPGWEYDDDCIAAVSGCYPIGTDALSVAMVTDVCKSELEETCLIQDYEGCGQSFCECTIGVYPFDWSNCWHLLLFACNPYQDEDCEGPLAECHPGATVEEYQACRDTVSNDSDCTCSSCGAQEQCEAALADCLGA